MLDTRPQAWLADDVESSDSWILRLSAAEIQGFRDGLSHLTAVRKPLLSLDQSDFPIPPFVSRRTRARHAYDPRPVGVLPCEGVPDGGMDRGGVSIGVLGDGAVHGRGEEPKREQRAD